jgi:hypothetical protein
MATDADLDARADRIAEGQTATLLKAAFEGRLQAREDEILRGLVEAHTHGTLTDVQARTAIAGIAELRKLVKDLTRTAERGQSAAGTLYSPPPAATRRP